MYPLVRMRRLRNKAWVRDLLAENKLDINDLIWPCFVLDGENIIENINSLPGVERYSIDQLLIKLTEVIALGIKAIAIFPVIKKNLKNEQASEAFNENGLIFKAVAKIKNKFPNLGVICDVALDPYTSHGHDGVVAANGLVDNDQTINLLQQYSLLLSKSGCDMVAPSDMMDGRIKLIREYLDQHGWQDVNILAYSVKYASAFYAGFRDAVGSKINLETNNIIDKKHYQLNYANIDEALREIELDITEGADIVMVKPALHYLDVIRAAKIKFNTQIWAYHVSSEYAMLKNAGLQNLIDYEQCLLETMTCFKRAGAGVILTYAALDVAKILQGEKL